MKKLLYALNIIIVIIVFATCKDEDYLLPGDNEPCYSIFVSNPASTDTRAVYEDGGTKIAVKWEKGDILILKTESKEFKFFYKQSIGDVGEFYHYGEIPLDGDKDDNKTFKQDAVLSFGTDGDNSQIQTQHRNNECREYLKANIGNKKIGDISTSNPVELYPEDNYSLLHIQIKSPATLVGKSMLKIKGLDKEYEINLGNDSDIDFVKQGESLDVYVIAPVMQILKGTALRFYLYSYDNDYEMAIDGDEYHYYLTCNANIKAENKSVVKIKLPDNPTHAAIQLGLSSGRKWATENIKSESNTDEDLYFWWGDVVGYARSTPHNFAQNLTAADTWEKSGVELKNEGIIGEDYNLVPERDAAVQHWGEEWKMPNARDFYELINNCSWTWNGVNGTIATSKINGKSIFFPAAGYRDDNNVKGTNKQGFYRSSSMSNHSTDPLKKAFGLQSSSDKLDKLGVAHTDGKRSTGLPIRPILASYSNPIMVPEIEGALSGEFSVNSDGKKVRFSKGNIQYKASEKNWRFAENQYDVVGKEGNEKISETYDGWIDLFNWGTSGLEYTGKAKYYQPYSTEPDFYGYCPNNDPTILLRGDYAQADWGYNAISNGGNMKGQWRTLMITEWNYILFKRTNCANLRSKAIVNGVYGIVMLPDNWYNQYGIPFVGNKVNKGDAYDNNVYTLDQWKVLESGGAVFLPSGGYRNEDKVVKQIGPAPGALIGDYWSITPGEEKSGGNPYNLTEAAYAHNVSFGNDRDLGATKGGWYRCTGHSVRVVRDVEYKY